MIVRPATSADAAPIAQVHVAAWLAAYRGLVPDSYLDGLTVEKRLELWQRRISQPGPADILIAEEDGKLGGFCLFGPSRDDDVRGKPTGELIALNVHPECWRRGVGRSLCIAALAAARGRGWNTMTLWILKGNERAARFYEALGFHFEGTERLDTHVVGAPIYELRYRRKVTR